jgi:hypothetical protein
MRHGEWQFEGTCHLQPAFSDIKITGNVMPGAIVEAWDKEDAGGGKKLPLATECAMNGVGEVPITREQQLVECGVGQQVSVQGMRPPRLEGADHNGQTRTQ